MVFRRLEIIWSYVFFLKFEYFVVKRSLVFEYLFRVGENLVIEICFCLGVSCEGEVCGIIVGLGFLGVVLFG